MSKSSAERRTNYSVEEQVKRNQEDTKNTSKVKEGRPERSEDDEIKFYLNPKEDEFESLRKKLLPTDPSEMNEDLKLLNRFSEHQLMFLLLTNADITDHLKNTDTCLYEALLYGKLTSDEMKILFLTNLRRQKLFLKLVEEDIESDDSDLDENEKLSERIRRRQIRNNLKEAYQYIPESFIDNSMTYIKCIINHTKIVAMLDTGSQDTFMSEECARKLELTRLIDTSWAGNTYGLGISRQVGRIHMVGIEIGGATILSSISVSAENKDLIIGLNIMKTHKCEIDLDRGMFYVGSKNVSTPILTDQELPESMKSSLEPHLT